MSLGPVRSHLRHATASAHGRVDALLPDGVSKHRDYAAYLRAMGSKVPNIYGPSADAEGV